MQTSPAHSDPQINESQLKEEPQLFFEPLEENYSKTIILHFFIFFIPALIIAITIAYFAQGSINFLARLYVIAPIIAPIGGIFIYAPLFAKSKGLAVCENEIHFKSGIVWQKTTSLTFNRIQHIEVESNPLERFFKHTTLKFYTAGGGGVDMKIPALSIERATSLRAFVMQKAGLDESDNLITPKG